MKADAIIRQRLHLFPLLRVLNDELLDSFINRLKVERFSAGAHVIQKGESGDRMFLLARGSVEIVDYTVDREAYTKAILDESSAVIFGEQALISGVPRTATVLARSDCECWSLSRDAFHKMGEEDPRLGWLVLREIASLLSQRLVKTNEDVMRLFEALVIEVESEAVGRR